MNTASLEKKLCSGEKDEQITSSIPNDVECTSTQPQQSTTTAGPMLVKTLSPTPAKISTAQASTSGTTEKHVADEKEGVVTTNSSGPHGTRTRFITGLRIIVVAMVVMCLAWTVWLLFLNIAPNSTVNRIMDTSDFESGSFWSFVDPPLPVYRLAIVGLSSAGLGYSFILVKLVTKRTRTVRVSPDQGALRRIGAFSTVIVTTIKRVATTSTTNRSLSSAASLATSLASDDSVERKRLVRTPKSFLYCN